jgi:adenylate kinase family enzyme
MRIVITGSPQAGKTTLANLLVKIFGLPLFQTDTVKHLGWSEASECVSTWFGMDGDWIIEGVTVPRALRKWQMNHPDESPPFDWFIFMENPRGALESGQETMRKQVRGLAETQRSWIGDKWLNL